MCVTATLFKTLSVEQQLELRRTALLIIGVKEGTDDETIISTAKIALQKHHPDRNPGDGTAHQRFCEISASLQILTDPAYRIKLKNVNTPRAPNTPTPKTHISKEIFKTLKSEAVAIGINEAFFQNLWLNKWPNNPEKVIKSMLTFAIKFYIGSRFPIIERQNITIDEAFITLLADS